MAKRGAGAPFRGPLTAAECGSGSLERRLPGPCSLFQPAVLSGHPTPPFSPEDAVLEETPRASPSPVPHPPRLPGSGRVFQAFGVKGLFAPAPRGSWVPPSRQLPGRPRRVAAGGLLRLSEDLTQGRG